MFENNKGMTKRAWFENHYGALEIGGPDLIDTGKNQAHKLGTEIKEETVLNIIANDSGFKIESDGGAYEAKYVLLATGAATDLAEHIGVQTKPGTEPRINYVDHDVLKA